MQFALAGASTVIISGRSATPLDETKSAVETAAPGCTIMAIAADVIDKTSVQKLFDRLPRNPDVLVNNAGVSTSQSSIIDSNIDLWWSDWETNVKGLYLFTRAYLQALDGKPGIILNVSSSVSDIISPNLSSYATSKAAVNRFTEFIHAEHAKQGVRCVAFHPGGIAETGMGQRAPEQFRSRLYDTVNLAAGTAVYLSTPRAGFLAGRFVFSNWDMEQLEGLKDQIVSEDLLKSRIRFGEQLDSATVPPQ
ncbi:hypothetical protein MMC22_007074 [Lobaria immixta]|nr:hypothetical protein [Lobaria immixta]